MQNWSDLRWPENDFSAVPYPVFYDQDVFNAEQERIFRGPLWCYAALQAEIPNPGDYKSTFVGDTPVVINRATDGAIHAFVNRCAHRGTLLVRDHFGNREDHTCIYHHWSYDHRGNLIGVPFQRGIDGKGGMPETFCKVDHGLERIRVETINGLIFGTFSETVEPLIDYLGPQVAGSIGRIAGREFRVLGYYSQWLSSHWKHYCELSLIHI